MRARVTRLAASGYDRAMESGKTPAVGDLAPDFALPDTHGATRRLSELSANSLVVLIFYRGHW
jgi:hypothetical protein